MHGLTSPAPMNAFCGVPTDVPTRRAMLVLRRFCAAGYDDWWVISCNHYRVSNGSTVLNPLDVGEGKAHRELTAKFGLRFTCVGGPCKPPPTATSCHPNNHFAPVFMLSAIGMPKGQEESGFDFRPSELRKWMSASRACAAVKDM